MADRLYRLLLWLCPAAFRAEYGAEMARLFRDRCRREGAMRVLLEALPDIIVAAARERTDSLRRDMSYGVRALRKSVGFTVVAVLMLALGIGANTVIFSLVNGVLLRPLAYQDPERLYVARSVIPVLSHVAPDLPNNARHFHEWRTRCGSCEEVALLGGIGLTLTEGGEPERLPGLQVSSNFFRTLGVGPKLGRGFNTAEELGDASRVVMLSDALWRRRFASDPSVIGRKVLFSGEPHEVIGVLPTGFSLPAGQQWGALFGHNLQPLIFRPLGFDVSQQRGAGQFNFPVLVRLRVGATVQQAQAEMNTVIGDFAQELKIEVIAKLIPLGQQMTAGVRTGLWTLLASVAAVLLIVCVNLGNLMLVRSTRRGREAAIRLALGASRARLFSQMLTEAFLLVTLGGALGLLLTYAGVQTVAANAPVDLPRVQEVRIDWRVLGFTASLAALSGLLCGLIPAWRLSRSQPQDSLKKASANVTDAGRKLRSREVLVAVEVALSAALLIVGGLLSVSFFRLMRVEKGFEPQYVITQNLSLGPPRYRDTEDRNRFIEETLRKLEAIPGVVAVGMTTQLPLQGETWIDGIIDVEKRVNEAEAANVGGLSGNYRFVTPGYWNAMGIALRRGRFFDDTDRNRKVSVVSEETAQRLWPGENPLGKRIRRGGNRSPMEIVGVVADVRAALEKEAPLTVYEPYWTEGPGGPSIVLRTSIDPGALVPQVRAAIASLDSELPIPLPKTMQQVLVESIALRRFQTSLAVAFALSALLLAALGIYGVLTFSIARRTSEMGIRMALGARAAQITSMVVRQGMLPVVVGLAVGVTGALMGARLIASQLYGVTPADPWTIAGVSLLLTVVGVLACWIPARRAARLDPLRALRFE